MPSGPVQSAIRRAFSRTGRDAVRSNTQRAGGRGDDATDPVAVAGWSEPQAAGPIGAKDTALRRTYIVTKQAPNPPPAPFHPAAPHRPKDDDDNVFFMDMKPYISLFALRSGAHRHTLKKKKNTTSTRAFLKTHTRTLTHSNSLTRKPSYNTENLIANDS